MMSPFHVPAEAPEIAMYMYAYMVNPAKSECQRAGGTDLGNFVRCLVSGETRGERAEPNRTSPRETPEC